MIAYLSQKIGAHLSLRCDILSSLTLAKITVTTCPKTLANEGEETFPRTECVVTK